MVELGTALRSMAADVEMAPEADEGDLWSRGRARVRRRRLVGAGVLAALGAVVALAGVLVPTPTVVMPVGPTHEPAVPRNIYVPDPDLAGTAMEGPLGRLAVLGLAERSYDDVAFSPSVFGISATTGSYRFLDLPDQVLGTPVAMSPDGRRVAYWTSGPTTGEAYDDKVPSGPGHVGGLAIYDSEDGSVVRAPFASEHGLSETIPFWVDSRTVAFEVWRKTTRTAARKVNTYFWTGSGTPRVTTSDIGGLSSSHRNRDGSFLVPQVGGYDRIEAVPGGFRPVRGGRVTFAGGVDQGGSGFDAVSTSGRLVAAVPYDAPGTSMPLMAGRLDDAGVVRRLVRVNPVWNVRLLGWRDARTVMILGTETGSDGAVFTADLRSGDLREIGRIDPRLLPSDANVAVASDLLAERLVHGRRPPSPPDRTWLWFVSAAGGSVAGLSALILWRRRCEQ